MEQSPRLGIRCHTGQWATTVSSLLLLPTPTTGEGMHALAMVTIAAVVSSGSPSLEHHSGTLANQLPMVAHLLGHCNYSASLLPFMAPKPHHTLGS